MEGEVADTQLGGHLPDEVRSATEHHTAVVVGGGQSGLATAYYLRRYEVDFLILDNQEEPGGAWLHAWPSLTLFSAAEFSNLPGWPMPRYPGYPPASHVIEMMFDVPENFPGGEIANVQRLAFKPTEQDRGRPLIGVAGKISDGFFWIALNDLQQAVQDNLSLMANEKWIDVPLAYETGQRALLSIEKGADGEAAFRDALAAWDART